MGDYDYCGRIGKHQTTLYTWCILAFHLLGSTLLLFFIGIGLFGGFTWAGGQAGGRRSYLFGCVFDCVATFSWAFDFLFLGNKSGGGLLKF
jgi:hypothetical protein